MSKGTIAYIGGFELPDKNAAAHRVLANTQIFQKLGYRVVLVGADRTVRGWKITDDSHYTLHDCQVWNYPYPINKPMWIKRMTSIDDFTAVLDQIDDLKLVIIIIPM